MGIDVNSALTLTLSPGEREQQFGVFCSLQIDPAADHCRSARRLGTILPLLRGDGRGEGQEAGKYNIDLEAQPGLGNYSYGH